MSSATFAGIIAHAAFWIVLLFGWWLGEIRGRGAALFVTLWIAGYAYCKYAPSASGLFAPYVAILAIALVFTIFKGDVQL